MPAPKLLSFDDSADRLIRKAYAGGNKKTGSIKQAAKQLGISTSSVHRRAAELGVLRAVYKQQTEWTDHELEILEANAHKDLESINRLLVKAGSPSRSLEAIKSKLKRIGIGLREAKIDAGIYSLGELARLMGVTPTSIKRRIKSGQLLAEARPDVDQIEYLIHAKQVRQFIIENLPQIDIAACDKYWLVDLLTGKI